MSVFRVNKNRNYTVMSNVHLRDKTLSYKAKGLLSYMLSCPDDWDYSLKGLTSLSRDGIDSVRTAIKALETHRYLRREKARDAHGHIVDYDYQVFEEPYEPDDDSEEDEPPSPAPDSPKLDFPKSGNPTQLNTKKQNTKGLIKMPGDKHPTRLKTLGENYTEEALQQRVQLRLTERSYKSAPPLSARDKYRRYQFSLKIATLFGLKKLYLHYCFLLGVLPKAASYRPLHPALRADLRKVEETMEQLKYISRHHVESLDDVTRLTGEKQTALGDVISQRSKCYNKLRRCTAPDEIAQIRKSRDGLSAQIRVLRKEIKLLQGIPPRVETIHRNVDLCEQLEKVQQRRREWER